MKNKIKFRRIAGVIATIAIMGFAASGCNDDPNNTKNGGGTSTFKAVSNITGIPSGIPMFDMMVPDGEQLIHLQPDIIIVTGMSRYGGGDMLKSVADAGICVIFIPSSMSIDAIKEDIRYIGAVIGAEAEGEALISEMETAIASVKAIGETITDKKRVYFELGAAPNLVSFGKGVFLNELLELIGAENIFSDREEWFSLTDETILFENPDVILTSVNYIDDPVFEIMSRPGWSAVTAVSDNAVFIIDTDSSNRPSHNIIIALNEMARAIYPDKYN